MKTDQVAIQLFTLREYCKTAAALAETATRVRKIGYTAVQLSGIGPIPDEEVVQIMSGEGLTICATHEPSSVILDETEKVIDRLHRLGCKLTAYPAPVGIDLTNPAEIEGLIFKLNAAGAKMKAAGLTLGYHNHAFEFVRYRGMTLLEYIYQSTHPQNLVGELDTYWIQYGGGDVVEWCEMLQGRLPFIHLKDYVYTHENKPSFCEIGSGNLRFDRIIETAEKSGCRWFIVEQDRTPADPFISIAKSFDYIKENLVRD